MARYGESRFVKRGDPDFEWDDQYRYGSWHDDWMLAEGEERTLAVVTNPYVMGKYVEAQQELGFRNVEVTPEKLLVAVLESIVRHERGDSAVEAKTIAFEVFGITDPNDSTYEWILNYLDGLCEIKEGVIKSGENKYQAILPKEPEQLDTDAQPEGDTQRQSAEDVEKLIRKGLGSKKRRRR